jgi:hypothetical protein
MTGEINRVPAGLLALLDMKARGQNPRMLSAETQLGLDALPLYTLNQRVVRTSGNIALNSAGYLGAFTVPNTDAWLLWSIAFRSSAALAAATTYAIAPAIALNNDAGALTTFKFDFSELWSAGDLAGFGRQYAQPILLGPNTSIGYWIERVTLGTAANFNFSVQYTPLAL